MKFVIVDAGQYAYENNKISPEYIDKLKGMYKLETIKVNKRSKELEYTIITIKNLVSLVFSSLYKFCEPNLRCETRIRYFVILIASLMKAMNI